MKNCPDIVTDSFYCSYNNLTSLIDGPSIVKYTYDCSHNNLISLSGAQLEDGVDYFDCSYNSSLSSLVGGPTKVYKTYRCVNNGFTKEEIRNVCKVGEKIET